MNKFRYLKRNKIDDLPTGSGVYSFNKEKELLYIGKAINIKERVKTHFFQPSFRDNLFIKETIKIGYTETNSEIEALILEAKLIKERQPKYNVIWKDDKNYFYVGKTKEDFPKVFITHQKNIKQADYAGPFVNGKPLKETLKSLRKAFPFRSCDRFPKKPCLWYQLNRCPAPCQTKSNTAKQIPTFKSAIKKEVRRNTSSLFKVLQGKKEQVLNGLKKEMKSLSNNQQFEAAAKIRNQINSLERIISNAKVLQQGTQSPRQEALMKLLKLKKLEKIEGYDISNIQGKEATGSMVTFVDGKPAKNLYRKFKIKMEQKPNDTAMLKEVLRRRLKHKEWTLPDLMVIDGGKGQLNAVKEIVKNKIPVISIAKKNNDLYIGKKYPIPLSSLPKETFNLILHMRDEAHRFAVNYHKKLRKKVFLNSNK